MSLKLAKLEHPSRETPLRLGPLADPNYRPLFSGHETFPLRQGWLLKAFNFVQAHAQQGRSGNPFASEDAIAELGVGKNMVAAIRHWATVVGVIEETAASEFVVTPFGHRLFSDDGDRYLEDPATAWLIHWLLVGGGPGKRPLRTAWYWLFNVHNSSAFTRDDLVVALLSLADRQGWRRVSRTTVQRDIDCLLRSYTAQQQDDAWTEEGIEPQLAELGLLTMANGVAAVSRSKRRGLTPTVVQVALESFWQARGAMRTLSLEALLYEAGSPGRVFCLGEDDLLAHIEAITATPMSGLTWSETAGLRQLVRSSEPPNIDKLILNAIGSSRVAYAH